MKIGCIGCGMMGSIILEGILKAGYTTPENLIASARSEKTRISVQERFGIEVTDSNIQVAEASDVIIVAVRPADFMSVVGSLADHITSRKIIISIASGITTDMIAELFPTELPSIIRINPNTPCMTRHGLSLIHTHENADEQAVKTAESIFQCLGEVSYISENLFDIATAVTGCSPAYVYMFIEAMADAAVEWGFPRKQAYQIIAQAVLGSACMVLETGKHPGELKDMVCSPGGTTILGVKALENNAFRGAIIEAISAVMEKTIASKK